MLCKVATGEAKIVRKLDGEEKKSIKPRQNNQLGSKIDMHMRSQRQATSYCNETASQFSKRNENETKLE